MNGHILATLTLTDETELSLIRLPNGLLALAGATNVLQIGTGRDLEALTSALQAVSGTLGPEGGG